jgi:membrane-associated phospholipid phosphatase
MQRLNRSVPSEQPAPMDKLPLHRLPIQRGYSPVVNLALTVLKYFFLFLAGFTIAYLLSASLGASQLVELLFELFTFCLKPLLAFTFCIVAIVIVVESWK